MDLIEIGKEVIESVEIKDVISHYLPLIKTGKNFKAVCPFHDDTNPSLTISPDKKIFKCFVCGVGGNAITFVQKYENLTYAQAIKKTAEICHLTLPSLQNFEPAQVRANPFQKEIDVLKFTTKYYQVALNSESGEDALKYVLDRGISEEQIRKFKIGFSPKNGGDTIKVLNAQGFSLKSLEDVGILSSSNNENYDRFNARLIFPISDEFGNVVGFSGRSLSADKNYAKYMNSPESNIFLKSKILYNFDEIKKVAPIRKLVYVCEGFMDVIALDRYHIPAIATMGTSLSKDHVRLLRSLKSEIHVLMDGDRAGRLASLKIARMLFLESLDVKVVHNREELRDPDEIIKAEGEVGIKKYLQNTLTYLDFLNAYYENDLDTKKTRDEYLKLAFEILDFYRDREADFVSFETSQKTIARVLKINLVTLQRQYQKHEGFVGNFPQNPSNLSQNSNENVVFKREISRLRLSESHLISMMLQSKDAVRFYEDKLNNLIDEVYLEIANFIIEIATKNNRYNAGIILASLEEYEGKLNKEELQNTILDLTYSPDKNPDSRYEEKACLNLIETIKSEQEKYAFDKQNATIQSNEEISENDRLRIRLVMKRQELERKKKKNEE